MGVCVSTGEQSRFLQVRFLLDRLYIRYIFFRTDKLDPVMKVLI